LTSYTNPGINNVHASFFNKIKFLVKIMNLHQRRQERQKLSADQANSVLVCASIAYQPYYFFFYFWPKGQ
jgi:hypothetical protein